MKTRRFQTTATSPGIAIGKTYCIKHERNNYSRYWIKNSDIELEITRLKDAIKKSKDQLDKIQTKICRFQGTDQIEIIESHRLFLQDDMLVADTIKQINTYKINAEWALDKILAQLRLSFLNMDEDYFRERQQDIDYVGRRIMDNLMGTPILSFNNLPNEDLILVVHDISPAEVASISKNNIKGFIMECGGKTSHTAIVARALDIPALFGMSHFMDKIAHNETIILDGVRGVAIASPLKRERVQYERTQEKYHAFENELMKDIHIPTRTKDNHRIYINGNMEILEEIPSLLSHGAEGIGLYRTEYLFLNRLDEPSEEEQYNSYVNVLTKLEQKVVTIRTVDLGGDKMPLTQVYDSQINPALGLRGIRLCLKETLMFRTQLRALLRASVHGNMQILFPMISCMEEIIQIKSIINDIKTELDDQNIPYAPNIPLGIMIEVPSAVAMATEFAKEVDFFSIGTNDLTQYAMAMDRTNEYIAHLHNPYEPSLLKMIKATVDAAEKEQIPVSVCGELAGDPLAIPILIGFGIKALSMNPVSIPKAKHILREITLPDSKRYVKRLLKLNTAHCVHKYLKKKVPKLLPDDFKKLKFV